MTVKDVLMHSAMTRLPKEWTMEERKSLVYRIIRVLQLEHVKDTVIGS